MLFKEIVWGISLNNRPQSLHVKPLRLGKEESPSRLFLPQVSLISILQKFSYSAVRDRVTTRRSVVESEVQS